MEKIIGREAEFGKLADYMESGKSEFIALYGRRRVGKTFLIRSFFKDQFDFYATGVISADAQILNLVPLMLFTLYPTDMITSRL